MGDNFRRYRDRKTTNEDLGKNGAIYPPKNLRPAVAQPVPMPSGRDQTRVLSGELTPVPLSLDSIPPDSNPIRDGTTPFRASKAGGGGGGEGQPPLTSLHFPPPLGLARGRHGVYTRVTPACVRNPWSAFCPDGRSDRAEAIMGGYLPGWVAHTSAKDFARKRVSLEKKKKERSGHRNRAKRERSAAATSVLDCSPIRGRRKEDAIDARRRDRCARAPG